jgi:hypothetical protein
MFLPFWPAYAGGAVVALFGSFFGVLARLRREFGLCFASALLVHVGLVIWLFWISARQPIPNSAILLFSIGVVWTAVLALYSMKRFRYVPNPKLRQALRAIGLEYIAFLFFIDFVVNPRKRFTVRDRRHSHQLSKKASKRPVNSRVGRIWPGRRLAG